MAPEMAIMCLDYTTKVDVWAFGVMIYKFLFGVLPFPAKSMV